MIDKNFIQKCQAFIEPNRFRLDEPMKLHTTFKIGGPADCLIFPASMEETEKVLALVSEYKLPLTILGNGSNVLVQDKGIRGVVVKFARPMAMKARVSSPVPAPSSKTSPKPPLKAA